MMHDGVPDEHDLENVGALDLGIARELGRELGEAPADRPRQLLLGSGVHHHVRHPAHQILAKADLRVHHPSRGDNLARMEIAEVPRDGRRADVEGNAVRGLVVTRPDRGDVTPVVDGDGDAPPRGAL